MTTSTLSTRTRLVVIAVTLLTALTLINLQITTKQRIITEGTTILLELAPRDPRSLLQGDYMALRYAMADEVARAAEAAGVSDGKIVVELNENSMARFVAIHNGQPLSKDQHLLQFRKRGESVRLASDAWFFEEGTGSRYRDARYGGLRVAEDGAAVLSGLRSTTYDQLGTTSRRQIDPDPSTWIIKAMKELPCRESEARRRFGGSRRGWSRGIMGLGRFSAESSSRFCNSRGSSANSVPCLYQGRRYPAPAVTQLCNL